MIISQKTAEITIKRMPVDELIPHPRNEEIRKHPAPDSAEWQALKNSLDHDYFDPIVWNKRNGYLVSGHLRLKVLSSMGFTHADVSVVDYDEPTHLCRLIAANKSIGDDIEAGLNKMLSEIAASVDVSLAGHTPEQFEDIVEDMNEKAQDILRQESVARGEVVKKVQTEFESRAKKEAYRLDETCDSEYWFCVCFQSRKQKDEFIKKFDLEELGDKHMNGLEFAKKFGQEIEPIKLTEKKTKMFSLNKKGGDSNG